MHITSQNKTWLVLKSARNYHNFQFAKSKRIFCLFLFFIFTLCSRFCVCTCFSLFLYSVHFVYSWILVRVIRRVTKSIVTFKCPTHFNTPECSCFTRCLGQFSSFSFILKIPCPYLVLDSSSFGSAMLVPSPLSHSLHPILVLTDGFSIYCEIYFHLSNYRYSRSHRNKSTVEQDVG